jgi:hypothetical protein
VTGPRWPRLSDGTTPLIRTDFSDEDAWRRVVAVICAPALFDGDEDTYEPDIVPISDPAFGGVSVGSLAALHRPDGVLYAILADSESMRDLSDLTVEYVDLGAATSFRCAAGEVALTEANLFLANMDFEDDASAVVGDQVFRGFAD